MRTKLLVGMFAVGLLVSNFTIGKNPSTRESLTLKNISLIQANAGEMYCDQKNEEKCDIEYGGAIGHSKGYLICITD